MEQMRVNDEVTRGTFELEALNGSPPHGAVGDATDHGAADRGAVDDEWPMPVEDQARRLHRRFMQRGREQAARDAEEMRDLRAAEVVQLWRHYGCATFVEYLEIRCGIEARTAQERIRVALALAELPLIEARLEQGEYSLSHVRELTRVVVGETEEEWVAHTRGMSCREVQLATAGHARGDRPGDPTQPDLRLRFFGWRLKPSTIARVQAVMKALEAERGGRFVDDDDRVNALCDAAESGRAGESVPAQVWVTMDRRAFANGVEIDDALAATYACDADLMGHVDDEHARTVHTITPRKRKRIMARDGNRCRVPGCRSMRHLEVHHIQHREDGGTDDDENLATLCHGHHSLHHEGRLQIAGTASNLVVRRCTDEVGAAWCDEPPIRSDFPSTKNQA